MKKTTFNQLALRAKKDQNVIGLILSGSRGRNFHRKGSDYDAHLIVKNKKNALKNKEYQDDNIQNTDLSVVTLKEFKEYAKWGSDFSWDRYDFMHIKFMVNKSKILKQLVNQKRLIPKSKQKEYINSSLDAYINSFFRSIKANQKGYKLGSHLEAAGSVPPLLNALFALELRHAPFYGYIKNELAQYPLKALPTSNSKLSTEYKEDFRR